MFFAKTIRPRCLFSGACLFALFFAPDAPAQATSRPPDAVAISGTLSKGNLTTADGKTFAIWQDERGKDLANTMNGVKVDLYAVPYSEGGVEYLKALDYVDDDRRAAHELWRRMRCHACAVQSANVNVTPPQDLKGARAVSGRFYSFKDRIVAVGRAGDSLWAATDNRVCRVDLGRHVVAGEYHRGNGLPDRRIYGLIARDGGAWILQEGGAAYLDARAGQIKASEALRASFMAGCADGSGVWIVGDTGTWRITDPVAIPDRLPALPTGARIGKLVEEGLWVPMWRTKTAHFIGNPVALNGQVFVESYGDVYGFRDGAWKTVAESARGLRPHGGKLWMLGAGMIRMFDPETGLTKDHPFPPDMRSGVGTELLVGDEGCWISIERPDTLPEGEENPGGLARLDTETGTWKTWKSAQDFPLDHISGMTRSGGALHLLARRGTYGKRGAHPGMTYVTRTTFTAAEMAFVSLDTKSEKMTCLALPGAPLDNRLICGQDGAGEHDDIGLQYGAGLLALNDRVFAHQHLYPARFFSGYWPCVHQVAVRDGADAPWKIELVHKPEALGLQGEQARVLNISNKGEMVLPAVGHDEILDLFSHGEEGEEAWAVTEGGLYYFDRKEAAWRAVEKGDYRFYWRATAALDTPAELFVGSDRGVVCRMDKETGLFHILGKFNDRAVERMYRDAEGRLVAVSRQAPLGVLPGDFPAGIANLGEEAAAWDGKKWSLFPPDPSARPESPRWMVKDIIGAKGRKNIQGGRDRSPGNFLLGPSPDGGGMAPRYYLKDVFWPEFLCESHDGKELWIGTYSGLLRVATGDAP